MLPQLLNFSQMCSISCETLLGLIKSFFCRSWHKTAKNELDIEWAWMNKLDKIKVSVEFGIRISVCLGRKESHWSRQSLEEGRGICFEIFTLKNLRVLKWERLTQEHTCTTTCPGCVVSKFFPVFKNPNILCAPYFIAEFVNSVQLNEALIGDIGPKKLVRTLIVLFYHRAPALSPNKIFSDSGIFV